MKKLLPQKRIARIPLLIVIAVVAGVGIKTLLFSSAATTNQGVFYYISPNGTGTGATEASPTKFSTLMAKLDPNDSNKSLIKAGDVVVFLDGNYNGTYAITRGGTAADSQVTYKAKNKWKAVLDGQNNNIPNGFTVNANYVKIQDFEIKNYDYNSQSSSGIEILDDNYITVVGNNIHDIGRNSATHTNGQVGIFVVGDNITIEQNYLHDIGRTPSKNLDHGIYMNSGNSHTVKNNVFKNFLRGYAVQMYPDALDKAKVDNNTFINGTPEKNGSSVTTYHTAISNSSISNNLFYNDGDFTEDDKDTTNESDDIILDVPGTNEAIEVNAPKWTNVSIVNNLSNGKDLYYSGNFQTGSGNVESGNKFLSFPKMKALFVNPTAGTPEGYALTSAALAAYPNVGATGYSSGTTPPPPPPPSDGIAPSVPTGLAATTTSSSINLSWTASTDNVGVTSYEVYRGTTLAGSPTSNSFNNTGLAANTPYTYTVKAKDAAGNLSAASSPLIATTQATADNTKPTVSLTAPTSGATLSGTATVTATASDNIGVTKVELYDGTTLIGTDNTSPYSIQWNTNSGTVVNGTHSLTAKAYDAANNNQTSNAVSVAVSNIPNDTTKPAVSITAPTSGVTVNGASVSLSATATDVAMSRVDFLVTNSAGATVLTASDTNNTDTTYVTVWNTTGVSTPNGTYTIKATAYDTSSNSSTSTISVAVNNTDQTPPAAPTTLNGSATTPTLASPTIEVNLTWTKSTSADATGYYVQRQPGINSTATETIATVNGGATAKYTDSNVLANTTYTYTVLAFDAALNKSTPSNAKSITTPVPLDTTKPPVPSGLAQTGSSASLVSLTWNAVTDPSGIVGYNIYRNGAKLNLAPITTTTYGDGTVSAATTYTYTVSAVDNAPGKNESPQSVGLDITTSAIAPPPPPTSSSVLNFNPSDDSYVLNGGSRKRNKNFGSAATLENVAYVGAEKNTYMKFNVSGVSTRVVTKAKLRLHVYDSSYLGGDFHKVTDNNWSQGSITWNNQPTFNTAKLASLGPVATGDWIEVDLTNLINGDGTYSIRIDSTADDTARYDSKETANKPQLILEVK